jgi:hypothetical protein
VNSSLREDQQGHRDQRPHVRFKEMRLAEWSPRGRGDKMVDDAYNLSNELL